MLSSLRRIARAVEDVVVATPHPPMRLPRVIQFPINDICNSRCQMCHIWKQKQDVEISPEEVRQVLRSKVFRKVEGVGINGGEPTLRRDIGEVTRAVVETLPAIQNIFLITNAVLEDQVTGAIDTMARVCGENNVRLDVMVSLDGVGEVHDRVRGKPGNFETAARVLEFVQNRGDVAARVGCTVIRENVFDVENVLQWCVQHDVYALFRIGIPHQRLYTQDISEPFALNREERFHFANFLDILNRDYETSPSRRQFYRSLRDQIAYDRPRQAGCLWKYAGATLGPRGELSYCAVASKTLGNSIEEDPQELYWGNADHLREIQRVHCAGCMHDYSGESNRTVPMAQLKRELVHLATRPAATLLPASVKTKLRTTISDRLQQRRQAKETRSQEETLARLLESASAAQAGFVSNPSLPNRILICGWYGTETLGDKAILGGIVEAIRSTADVSIDVASLEPYVTRYTQYQMPQLELDRILNLDESKRAVAAGEYAAVVMGGGPLMGSISQCRDMLELFTHVKSVGGRCVVAGCGVGPLGWPMHDPAISKLLEVADAVLLRDAASLERARSELGFAGEAQVILDPAFAWIEQAIAEGERPERNPRQVLLALRDWPIQEYAAAMSEREAGELKHRFESELRQMVEHLLSADLDVIPFCMHKLAVGGDDRAFYRRLFANEPRLLGRLDPQHRPPHEDLRLFAQSGAVVAMRYHSLVFALGTGTPFVAIDYTLGGKVSGLVKDLSCDDRLVALQEFDGRAAAANVIARLESPTVVPVSQTNAVLCQTFERLLPAGMKPPAEAHPVTPLGDSQS